jgi:hypothetical protein
MRTACVLRFSLSTASWNGDAMKEITSARGDAEV